MTTLRRCLVLSAAAFLCACSTNSNRAQGVSQRDQARLSADDVRRADPNLTLFEFVSRERPQWLTRQGSTPLQVQSDVVVYRDDIRVGGRDALREIRMDIVSSVRYLTASEATGRFGLNHQHGAILVSTRR